MSKIPRKDRDRAYRLRQKDPDDLSPADHKFLADYDKLAKAAKANGKSANKADSKSADLSLKKESKKVEGAVADQDMKAAKKIANCYSKFERAEERLTAVRKDWNERIAEEKVAFSGTIEASTAEQFAGSPQRHLNDIVARWQEWQEAIAGKKMEVHEALDEKRKSRERLKKAVENAKQMDMFD